MSIQTNKSAMFRFIEFINTSNRSIAEEVISEKAIFYAPTNPNPLKGIDGYMLILDMMRSSFPDINWKLEDIVTENDLVAARFTMTGTHTGNFFDIEPTHKKIKINAMNLYRFSNGKIIEEYGQPDIYGLLKQIEK